MASEAAIYLGLLILLKAVQGFVIAPPWANPVINPCSEKSWQLIYWPQDGACYQIFEQGPCPDTQELAFHPTNKRVSFHTVPKLHFLSKTSKIFFEFFKGHLSMSKKPFILAGHGPMLPQT